MDEPSVSAKEIFNRYAQTYEERFMDVGVYAPSLLELCSLIPEKADILEVGCGPGNVTRYLLDQRPDMQVFATDLAKNMLKLAKKNAPGAKIAELDGRNIGTLKQKFDAIVAAFFLPYLTLEEAKVFIKDCHTLLHENGILYLSTMEGEADRCGLKLPSSSEGPGTYMAFYTEHFLRKVLEETGFSLHYFTRVQQSPDSDTDVLLIGRRTV